MGILEGLGKFLDEVINDNGANSGMQSGNYGGNCGPQAGGYGGNYGPQDTGYTVIFNGYVFPVFQDGYGLFIVVNGCRLQVGQDNRGTFVTDGNQMWYV